MNLLWIDVETTGLNPEIHEIIDIALVETDRQGNILATFNSKLKPQHTQYEIRALEVNGYTPELWKNAPEKNFVFEEIGKTFSHSELYTPAGWNIAFDMDFCKYKLKQYGLKIHHHSLDLMGMGWSPEYDCYNGSTKWDGLNNIEKPHLEHLCKMLGVEYKDAHTAMGDVRMCIECYKRII